MTTFISVGNALQPFERLANIITKVESLLPKPIFIQSGHTYFKCKDAIIRKKITLNEFEEKVSGSNVLILHAGAGSVIHALQKNKIPILMAREKKYGEHIDDHQVEFANALKMQKKVLLFNNEIELKIAISLCNKKQIKNYNNNIYLEKLLENIIKNSLN